MYTNRISFMFIPTTFHQNPRSGSGEEAEFVIMPFFLFAVTIKKIHDDLIRYISIKFSYHSIDVTHDTVPFLR